MPGCPASLAVKQKLARCLMKRRTAIAPCVGDAWAIETLREDIMGVELETRPLKPGFGIEVTGRFIGEQHARIIHQSPRDCHPLPLPSG